MKNTRSQNPNQKIKSDQLPHCGAGLKVRLINSNPRGRYRVQTAGPLFGC